MHDHRVSIQVELRNVAGEAAAIGSAGPFTLVVDRPVDGGGLGLGFNGGQLLYLAIGGCVSNDLFRGSRHPAEDRSRDGSRRLQRKPGCV